MYKQLLSSNNIGKIIIIILLSILVGLSFSGCENAPRLYSITYVSNGYSSNSTTLDSKLYAEGENIQVLSASGLAQEGHVFIEWNTEPDGTGESYQPSDLLIMPAHNMVLYAMWNLGVYSLTYNGNGNTAGTAPPARDYGHLDSVQILEKGTLRKTGYNFVGWNTKHDGTGTSYNSLETFLMPSHNIVLYAIWNAISFKVEFNTDGGSPIESQSVDYNQRVNRPENPILQDNYFTGWYTDPECTTEWDFSTDVITQDITLYGKWIKLLADSFSGGTGTQEDPYQVSTFSELNLVRYCLDSHFIQKSDIDLSIFSEGSGWEPIGVYYGLGYSENEYLRGSYNGDGYEISNLTIKSDGENYIGLFAFVSDSGSISNLSLTNVNVVGNNSVGSLIGYCDSSGTVSNVSVEGTIVGKGSKTGGLIGYNQKGTIENCEADIEVIGSYTTGGLIGYNSESNVVNNSVTGTITFRRGDFGGSDSCIGGLIGYNVYSDISTCYSHGSVTGGNKTGGLVGKNVGGQISDCYSTATVEGLTGTGGLIGHSTYNYNLIYKSKIEDSYSTGNVSGTSEVGGLIGNNYGGIYDCFSTGNVSGSLSDIGGLVGAGGSISRSYSTGSVSGSGNVGGLLGSGYTVLNCYSESDVFSSGNNVGGLVGHLESNRVTDCYAVGSVTGNERVGGLIGRASGDVEYCYSTGKITGSLGLGGLIGVNSSIDITSSYYDSERSGCIDDVKGLPKSTIEMKQIGTFTGWNFSTIWGIEEGETYPYLL